MNQIEEQIINLSFSYFTMHPVTPLTIRDFIVQMKKGFDPGNTANEKELYGRLEAIHSVVIEGDAKILDDSSNHEEWFNPDTNLPLKRDFKWHFWDHYQQYLGDQSHWSSNIIKGLDRFSSIVLSRCEDPNRQGPWDRRGMVVGNVQSGKTANYTALITKAADAGYKLFIVLAGVHNSLRSQTQERINEEFLGYDLDIVQKVTGQERRIGVRRMFPKNHGVVNTLTSNAQDGDFKTAVARNAGIIPSLTGDPIILVVKKNVSILNNLIDWATSLGYPGKNDRRIVKDIPFLLIDDECDFASINTKKPERDEYGHIIQEWDPTTTNKLIRELLSSFEKSVYVGYTATPYANIFIDKEDPHPIYGEDLFPRHFLVSLPQPSNYMGPEEVFGLKEDRDTGIETTKPLPLVRIVLDNEDIIPNSHKSSLDVTFLPDSLKKAIKAFLLVCAARRIRSTGVPHNSMLIHVTRFTHVQSQIKDLVENELRTLTARIMSGTDFLSDFKQIWETDFLPTSEEMLSRGFRDVQKNDWDSIRSELYPAVKSMRIKGINGEIGDTFDYRLADRMTREKLQKGELVPWTERGTSVIAIGGDKLSRGLTLEGLSVSYYLRAAKMYDTLMQMGRWFGYRVGYIDLCRIYITGELIEWYSHIALANRELRNEFEYMEAIRSSPENFGLKVRSHPGRLAVTSAGKSRATEKISVTFAGHLEQTIVFDPKMSQHNMSILERLVNDIGRKPDIEHNPRRPRLIWKDISPDLVIRFLESYRTHKDAYVVVNPQRYAEYIKKQVSKGELINWCVVIVSNTESEKTHELSIAGNRVRCVSRQANLLTKEKISIGVLTSPVDETLDLDNIELAYARSKTKRALGTQSLPSGLAIRSARPSTRGLLLIYPLESNDGDNKYGLDGNEIYGFAISFPGSNTATSIEYIVNSVYSEEAET